MTRAEMRRQKRESEKEHTITYNLTKAQLDQIVNSLVQKNSTHRNPIIFRKLSNNENFKLHRFLDLRSKCLYSSINHMISYVTYGLNARLIQKYTKYGYISSNTRGERFRCYISIENRMQKICIGYKDMWMLCWKSKSGKWLEGRWKKCYEKNLIIMKKIISF